MQASMSFQQIMASSSSSASTTTTRTKPMTMGVTSSVFRSPLSCILQTIGGNRKRPSCLKKAQHTHLYWILISLNIFIALAYCDDDIIAQSTQSLPQKRSGGGECSMFILWEQQKKRTDFICLFVLFMPNNCFYFPRILYFVYMCVCSLFFFCTSAVLAGTATSRAGEAGVLDIKDHCNKTVEIYEDVSSPELTNANRNRPLLCTYRFRSHRGTPRDWVLRIRFKKFKVGNILNATHCDGGYLQVNHAAI